MNKTKLEAGNKNRILQTFELINGSTYYLRGWSQGSDFPGKISTRPGKVADLPTRKIFLKKHNFLCTGCKVFPSFFQIGYT